MPSFDYIAIGYAIINELGFEVLRANETASGIYPS